MLHDKYGNNLEDAREFEDFVADVLHTALRLQVHMHRSRKYQVKFGENALGLEVKLDRRWRETGRLFIETEERWNADVPFRPAGIYGPNWLYLIGDQEHFWLFATRILQNIECHCEVKQAPAERPTARGFVLPVEKADRWAAWVFDSTPS